MHLGSNIKAIRNKWRMSQEEFGDIFSIKKGAIHTYEKGDSEPRISFILKLYELTGIPFHVMCGRVVEEEDIPDSPGLKLDSGKMENPTKSNKLSMVEEPLYNYHLLVTKLRELEERVKGLEGK